VGNGREATHQISKPDLTFSGEFVLTKEGKEKTSSRERAKRAEKCVLGQKRKEKEGQGGSRKGNTTYKQTGMTEARQKKNARSSWKRGESTTQGERNADRPKL